MCASSMGSGTSADDDSDSDSARHLSILVTGWKINHGVNSEALMQAHESANPSDNLYRDGQQSPGYDNYD